MRIISRAEWGAKHGRGAAGLLTRGEVVVHTAAGGYPGGTPSIADDTQANESQLVRNIEHFHVNTRGWAGIAYSFLVAPSGRAYEGRGWGRDGSHTETRNRTAYAICFLGHGDQHAATEQAWAGAQGVVREGLRLGHIARDYVVTGHRNYSGKGKSCPGDLIYPHIGRLRGLTATTPAPAAPPEEADVRPADVKRFLFSSLDRNVWLCDVLSMTREAMETDDARVGIAHVWGIDPQPREVHPDVMRQFRITVAGS